MMIQKEEEDKNAVLIRNLRRMTAQRYDGKNNVIVMPKGKRDVLIDLYERAYPEDRTLIERFFDRFQRKQRDYDFSDDIANIKYIIYSADSRYRNVILKCLPYVRLVPYRKFIVKREERYNYYQNKITIKLSNLKELEKEPNPYLVFFHELSHAVDDVSCRDIFFKVRHNTERQSNEAGEKLQDIARREAKAHVYASIHNFVIQEGMRISEQEEKQLLEDIFSPCTEFAGFSNPDVERVYQSIRNMYGYMVHEEHTGKMTCHKGTEYPLYQRRFRAVSDVLGGYTKNTVGACPIGHFSPFYWFNLLGKETGRQSRELWAEYSAYLITGDRECIAGTEEFFPESCAFIRNIWLLYGGCRIGRKN